MKFPNFTHHIKSFTLHDFNLIFYTPHPKSFFKSFLKFLHNLNNHILKENITKFVSKSSKYEKIIILASQLINHQRPISFKNIPHSLRDFGIRKAFFSYHLSSRATIAMNRRSTTTS